ncbi:MAG: RNB domain-containing ribonuclease [Opitutaceae bacterium]|nr:RNB domain-containing ribonuclease [Opitutaceae bacterium]
MELRQRLLSHLARRDYVPISVTELARQWRTGTGERRRLSGLVQSLLLEGAIVAIKGNRLCLPRAANLVSGRINFRQNGAALVFPEAKPNEPDKPPVYISAENTGVALHGDRVVARILDPADRDYPRRRTGDEAAGQVIRILERARTTLTGTLHRGRLHFYVRPDDPRYPHDILVPDPTQAGLKPPPIEGDKVIVKLHDWTERHLNPEGVVTDRLGRTFEPGAELAAILHKYNLEPGFPPAVRREIATLPGTVPVRDCAGRLDYRGVPTFTIDPDDAKDFDDALSFETLAGGEIRVGVHIADVSHYVRQGSALDREARRRGNSTYLVGVVVPMLPVELSNGLCSLVEGEDRLTKAVLFTFGRNGRLRHTACANTVIRSRKRLTYRQAFALLFEDRLDKIRRLPPPPMHQTGSTGRPLSELSPGELADLQHWVRQLWTIASRLRLERMKGGSLDLDMPETKIFVDQNGFADRLELITNDESHQLIEEFMLLANEAVARITRTHHLSSLYRVHDDPDEERLEEYRKLLATFGVKAGDLSRRENVVHLLPLLRRHPQGHLLRTQLLRSMRKACYRPTPDGHYGLNKKDYTHFTSPIRRYSDLAVHRVFDSSLARRGGRDAQQGRHGGSTSAGIATLAEHLSLTEINSTEAERESVKVKLLEFFERELDRKKKTHFPAIITDVRTHGFFVELTESGAFGLVHISSLKDDFYQLNSSGTTFIGRKNHRRFELGHKISVVVHRVDREKRLIDFSVPN